MNYRNHALEMYHLLYQGQPLKAFELFYHDRATTIEASGAVRKGKHQIRKYKKQFISSIKEINDGGVESVAIDEVNGITMVESWLDVSFLDGQRCMIEEVVRQKWIKGQIIEERYYNHTASLDQSNRTRTKTTIKKEKVQENLNFA